GPAASRTRVYLSMFIGPTRPGRGEADRMTTRTEVTGMRPRPAPALVAVPALAAAMLLPACAARAQQPATVPAAQERTITVSGRGVVDREPDQAVIMLAVESSAATA